MRNSLEGLKKKFARLERKYEKAKGPIERERIMKAVLATQKAIDKIEGNRQSEEETYIASTVSIGTNYQRKEAYMQLGVKGRTYA